MKKQFHNISFFLKEQKSKINRLLKKLGETRTPLKLNKSKPKKVSPAFFERFFKSFSVSEKSLKVIVILQALTIIGMIGVGLFYAGKISIPFLKKEEVKLRREIPKAVVEALPVEIGTFNTYTNVVGTLKANESVVIRPQVDGMIEAIRFKSGDSVLKGDELIKMEDGVYVALLAEAEAKLELYKGKYERARILYDRKSGTLKERDEMFAQMKIAQAEVNKAKTQLSKTVLRAPFDGVIGLKNVSPGAYVRVGEDLVTLDDIDPMKLEFRLGENMIDKVEIGKILTVEIDGFPDNLFEARIEAVDTNVDPMGHSIRVRAVLDNKEDLFKPGLYAKVKLLLSAHDNVAMVPESAVESRGNQEYVYRVENGVALFTPVKTGGRNGEMIEILSGLEPGQTVVVSGQMKIVQDNWPVQAIPPYVLKRIQEMQR